MQVLINIDSLIALFSYSYYQRNWKKDGRDESRRRHHFVLNLLILCYFILFWFLLHFSFREGGLKTIKKINFRFPFLDCPSVAESHLDFCFTWELSIFFIFSSSPYFNSILALGKPHLSLDLVIFYLLVMLHRYLCLALQGRSVLLLTDCLFFYSVLTLLPQGEEGTSSTKR